MKAQNKHIKPHPHSAILGGGAAGLAAGYYALKKNLNFIIYEAARHAGGNCSTDSYGEYHFDRGAHRFHDKDDDITQEIRSLIRDDLQKIDIRSQIYLNDQFIDFPLSPLNLLKTMGVLLFIKSGLHWLLARFRPKPKTFDNFEQFAIYKYGRPIAEQFLLNYSEKLWGRSCDQLTRDITGKRLKGLCLSTFIMETVAPQRMRSEHLDGVFYYPKRGFGEIVNRLAQKIGNDRIQTGAEVTRIFHNNNHIEAIELNHHTIMQTDRVISTLPLTRVIEMLHPACRAEILKLARSLSFRSLLIIQYMLNLDFITRSGTVYFPDRRFPFNRISEPKNRSRWMSPPGKTSLLVEIPCEFNQYLQEDEQKERIHVVSDTLKQIGWIEEKDIIDINVDRIKYAYPILDIQHVAKLEVIMDYLSGFDNLYLTGRNSLFKYTHFHDMMMDGKAIMDRISR